MSCCTCEHRGGGAGVMVATRAGRAGVHGLGAAARLLLVAELQGAALGRGQHLGGVDEAQGCCLAGGGEACREGVARQVVELVDVDAVALVVHDVEEEALRLEIGPEVGRPRLLVAQAVDEGRHETQPRVGVLEIVGELDPVGWVFDELPEDGLTHALVRPLGEGSRLLGLALCCELPPVLVDELLEHVAERPVPDIVHESRQLHAQDVFVIDAQLRLAGSQVHGRHACQVSHSYRVLLASVVGRRKDI